MPTYIIAEIGINHEGLISKSKKLIKLAKSAGADAVKFQLFEPETLASKDSIKTTNQKKLMKKESLYEMWNRVSLNFKKVKELKYYAKKNKIDFFCSVFDFNSLKIIKKLKIRKIKIASSDITDIPLLKEISKTKFKIYLSTGMASFNEISKAVKILKNNNLTLLHCVSLYPCPLNKVNMKRMLKLKSHFKLKTGFSDHCKGIDASILSINLGAETLEKHFTDNKNRKGSDHSLSADYKDLKFICEYSKKINQMLGSGKIKPSKEELIMKKFARKSIYYDKNLNINDKIKMSDLKIRRPFNGIEPFRIKEIINKKLTKDVKKNEAVNLKHLN